jgi:LL-diaminopimelate aminotransferase
MVKRNDNIAKLNAGYLFPEINRRKRALLQRVPDAKLISLGIGDTTEPIASPIVEALVAQSKQLGTKAGYRGYGPEQGIPELREKIASVLYDNTISSDDIFISDGSKCDIGRLQLLFGAKIKIAVQDPSYPVYVDTAVTLGQTGHYTGFSYEGITYMNCRPENQFFPELNTLPKTDLIYFCSPNNPTGAVASRDQLTELVQFAKENHSILIFDAAYRDYIQNPDLPKSIYEIEGAENVAIELGSFSKMAGFTGIRLSWSVVPETLKFEDGSSVKKDWSRITSTFFNGASILAQAGGLAALSPTGRIAILKQTEGYLQNAKAIQDTLSELGYKTYGGENAPYIWAHFPGRSSWDMFEELLEQSHIVTTPGAGFGPAGEQFLRFSAFGNRSQIDEALERLKQVLAPV